MFKVLVVGSELETAGGSFIVERYLIEILKNTKIDGNFEFIFQKVKKGRFLQNLRYETDNLLLAIQKTRLVDFLLKRLGIRHFSKLEKECQKLGISVVFFLGVFRDASSLQRVPYILTIWDVGHRKICGYPEVYDDFRFERREDNLRIVARKAIAVLCDSQRTKDSLIKSYGFMEERLHIVEFIPMEFIRKAPFRVESKLNLNPIGFYPANFWPHKNHFVLLEALKLNQERGIDSISLHFAGADQGNMQAISRYVEDNRLQDKVVLHKFLSREKVIELYLKSSVVFFPSLLGPTNIPPLEALFLGVPLVVSNISNLDLHNLDGVIALDPKSKEAWAEVIKRDVIFIKPKPKEVSELLQERHDRNIFTIAKLFRELTFDFAIRRESNSKSK